MPVARSRKWPPSPERAPDSAFLPVRFDRHEFAGNMGNIGVMSPLAVGVCVAAHLSLVNVVRCIAARCAGGSPTRRRIMGYPS